ncbi:sigma-E processing peptidase SpoIIGA [Amphibacillus jilinensis]|uniref:sigma-E processing peptidase SpoIIGA n=1 Tax=Amphibacillus jilinensis TaxID=1216008 RepID=UPI0003760DDD|nr:sigma-E processing peptidase SpoIIGA [Amphibacillus jilinensis]
MTIYLDAIWVLNLLIDFMILQLTGYLVKKKNRGWSVWLASLFASSMVFIAVLYPSSIVLHPLGKILFSCVILFIGFKYVSFIDYVKTLMIFYFASFTLGGALMGVHFLFQQSFELNDFGFLTVSTGFGTPISWGFVVIGFPLCWWFTRQTMDKQTLINYQAEQIYSCQIKVLNRVVNSTAYLDSANHLIDPISQKPVVIIDNVIIKQLFSEDMVLRLKQMNQTLDLSKQDNQITNMIHFIPYQDVSNENGILLALKPDLFAFSNQTQAYRTKNVLLGLRFGPLSSGQHYHCLLNPKVFNRSETA